MRRVSALRAPLALACACLLPVPARSDFHRGDLVSASRRAQFHGSRTQWHDLLARHCPTFAVDRVVALPIPKPLSFRPDDEYKIALSFDGDRHATTWLPVLAPSSSSDDNPDPVPMLDVELVHGHGHVLAARASRTSSPSPPSTYDDTPNSRWYMVRGPETWPKHLLVRYRWTERVDVGRERGARGGVGSVCGVERRRVRVGVRGVRGGNLGRRGCDGGGGRASGGGSAREGDEKRDARRRGGGEGVTSQSRARRMDATRERHVGMDEGGR